MAEATIKLVNAELLSTFYFTKRHAALAQELLNEGRYKVAGTMGVPGREGMAAAEEIFDLTNNPSRIVQRDALYGRFRSVSVGDIVNVDGTDWLCCPLGWWQL